MHWYPLKKKKKEKMTPHSHAGKIYLDFGPNISSSMVSENPKREDKHDLERRPSRSIHSNQLSFNESEDSSPSINLDMVLGLIDL